MGLALVTFHSLVETLPLLFKPELMLPDQLTQTCTKVLLLFKAYVCFVSAQKIISKDNASDFPEGKLLLLFTFNLTAQEFKS